MKNSYKGGNNLIFNLFKSSLFYIFIRSNLSNMKSLYFCLLSVISLFFPNGFSIISLDTISNKKLNNDIESDIREIRKEYARINNLKLESETFRYSTKECVENGEITYFSLNGKILKAVEKGAMNDTFWSKEYYYKEQKVFFCLEKLNWGAATGPTTQTAYRFYIKNGKSIREMSDNKVEELKGKAYINISIANRLIETKATKNFASIYDSYCEK